MEKKLKFLRGLGRIGLLAALSGCIKISPAIPSWPVAPQGELTLAAADDFIIQAQINGHPVRLRVETGYSGVIVNPDVAARVGLVRSMWENDVLVGPVLVQGETGMAPLVIGTARDRRRIVWFEKNITTGADGIINIASLPYSTVTLQLAPPGGDETSFELRTSPNRFWSVTYDHKVGDREVEVRFALDASHTLLTAAAGAHLATQNGGTWAGDASQQRVGFGVSRPARPMQFARPVTFAGFLIDRAVVRTSDFRGGPTNVLPDAGVADRSEIVVTGPHQKSRPLFTAIIGRDYLSTCSSIRYSTSARLLTLRCGRGHSGY